MLGVQLTFGVDHPRLQPAAEFDARRFGFPHQMPQTVGQFFLGLLPVAEARPVVVAGEFVAEPAILQQEQINAEFLAIFGEFGQFRLIEVKSGGFLIVEQPEPVAVALRNAVVSGPAVVGRRKFLQFDPLLFRMADGRPAFQHVLVLVGCAASPQRGTGGP